MINSVTAALLPVIVKLPLVNSPRPPRRLLTGVLELSSTKLAPLLTVFARLAVASAPAPLKTTLPWLMLIRLKVLAAFWKIRLFAPTLVIVCAPLTTPLRVMLPLALAIRLGPPMLVAEPRVMGLANEALVALLLISEPSELGGAHAGHTRAVEQQRERGGRDRLTAEVEGGAAEEVHIAGRGTQGASVAELDRPADDVDRAGERVAAGKGEGVGPDLDPGVSAVGDGTGEGDVAKAADAGLVGPDGDGAGGAGRRGAAVVEGGGRETAGANRAGPAYRQRSPDVGLPVQIESPAERVVRGVIGQHFAAGDVADCSDQGDGVGGGVDGGDGVAAGDVRAGDGHSDGQAGGRGDRDGGAVRHDDRANGAADDRAADGGGAGGEAGRVGELYEAVIDIERRR